MEGHPWPRVQTMPDEGRRWPNTSQVPLCRLMVYATAMEKQALSDLPITLGRPEGGHFLFLLRAVWNWFRCIAVSLLADKNGMGTRRALDPVAGQLLAGLNQPSTVDAGELDHGIAHADEITSDCHAQTAYDDSTHRYAVHRRGGLLAHTSEGTRGLSADAVPSGEEVVVRERRVVGGGVVLVAVLGRNPD